MVQKPKRRTSDRKAATNPSSRSVPPQGQSRPVNLNDQWAVIGGCLLLLALVWVVFGQTLRHGFVNLDDPDYVFSNPEVVRGLTIPGIIWAFTHVHASNWHPLTWISHMLDCQFYGLDAGRHHLTSILLHLTAAILLFLVLRLMTGALWRSAFVAIVFAIHPLRVESVAWVAERKDVLSGVFFMLTLGAYLRYVRRPWSASRYLLVFFLFALGLMAKPMLVTVPFVLLLLDYWPLNRFAPAGDLGDKNLRRRNLVLEKLPLLALAAASGVATLFAQKVAIRPLAKIPMPLRVENAAVSCLDYLRQMFWPSDLAVFYPSPRDIGLRDLLVALIILTSISAGVLILRLRRPYLLAGWLWYLIMLAPVIGIVQVGAQAQADRYTYLPHIGLYLLVAWGAADLCSGWRYGRFLLSSVCAGILLALVLSARSQVSYWQNSETLWRHAVSCTTANATAKKGLGDGLREQGRLDEAIAEYKEASRLDPEHWHVYLNLGVTYLQLGRTEESVAHLQKAVEINPASAEAESTLGVALLARENLSESVAHLHKALEIQPGFGSAHYNLGNTFLRMGRVQDALFHYQRAVELDPKDVEAQNNLAWILATWPDTLTRDGTKAVALAERANSLTHGESPIISATLAAAYAESGRFDDAVKMAQRALQLALAEGNVSRADSIRAQLELYQAGFPFRDRRPRP